MPSKWSITNGVKYTENSPEPSSFNYGGDKWDEVREVTLKDAWEMCGTPADIEGHTMIREIYPSIISLGENMAATQIQRTWKWYKYEQSSNTERNASRKNKKEQEEEDDTYDKKRIYTRKTIPQWDKMKERKAKRKFQEWSPVRKKIIKPLLFSGKVRVRVFSGNKVRDKWKKTERRDGTHSIQSHFGKVITNYFDKKLGFDDSFWEIDEKRSEHFEKFNSIFDNIVSTIEDGGNMRIVQGGSPFRLNSSHLLGIKSIWKAYKEK